MNILKIVQELLEEKKRIDKAIAALEELATGESAVVPEETADREPPRKRRGRPRKNPQPAPLD